jgi:TrkA domain protein
VHTVLRLSQEDTAALGELFGLSQVSDAVVAAQRLEGVAIDWVTVPAGSPIAGATIGDGQFRTRTGASIVAIIRGDTTVPAPGPEAQFEAGDVAVAVGTPEGLSLLRSIIEP